MKRLLILALMLAVTAVPLGGCVTAGEHHPIATVSFSDGGTVRFRLYPEYAPNTVANFISLANSGFYDGSPVHRIEEYFVVQTGKPAEGRDSTGYTIKGEFSNNGYSKNTLAHEFGTVSMARVVGSPGKESEFYDSASSQFFITTRNHLELDGDYAAFGKVTEGKSLEELVKISQMDVSEDKTPRDEI
jgi:cyclophilin family peptidyl-prolyl cis-trans isomerase